jgi:hypothetical protein
VPISSNRLKNVTGNHVMRSKLKIDLKVVRFASYLSLVAMLSACLETVTTGGGQSVTERGILDPTLAWPGAGNYTAFDETTLTASKVCSDKSIFGEAGTAVCQSGAATDAAVAANVVQGKEYFDGSGALVMGTAVDHGAINLGTSAIPSSGGFFSSIVLSLTGSDVCVGKSIFGSLGRALCPEEISSGNAFRSSGSLSMAGERSAGTCNDTSYSTRYTCERAAPTNVWTPFVGSGERIATTSSDDAQPAATRNAATFTYANGVWSQTDIDAGLICGASGNLETRIADCNRSWKAIIGSKAGGGTWSLVSRQEDLEDLSGTKYEVWRDDKSGLVWSDYLGTGNHCEATGDDGGIGNCIGAPSFSRSFCAETGFSGNVSGIGIVSATGVFPAITNYDVKKAGMGLFSTKSILWRLPTLQDYSTAIGNGLPYVLPNVDQWFWSASVRSYGNGSAYKVYVDSMGEVGISNDSRNSTVGIRCVGR